MDIGIWAAALITTCSGKRQVGTATGNFMSSDVQSAVCCKSPDPAQSVGVVSGEGVLAVACSPEFVVQWVRLT